VIPNLSIGPFVVSTHDVFTVLGLSVGLAIYYGELRRRGWLDGSIVWISLAAILGAVIGARTITAWEHLDYYAAATAANLSLTELIENSGKSLIGAVAGGYLATVLAKRRLGYTRSTGDCYVLAIPVATAIGRIGCFLTELPLGTPTTLPWGMSVDPAIAASFGACRGCATAMHPSMLYEIAFNVAAVVVIWRLRDRVPIQGDALKAYLLAAATFRFLVESVRGNEPQALGLTGPQWVLLPLVMLLLVHFGRRLRSGAYRVPVPSPVTGFEGTTS
jgi:phosphatidylglycerol---prolipoprotein diacylglyceryl transferase